MNEIEARSTLAKHIGQYRSRSYAYLATSARLGRTDTAQIAVEGGGVYQIDVKVGWEKHPDQSVKVTALIRDGIGRAGGSPIVQAFVIPPSEEFAGE
jgi:hypothetical protein